MRASAAEIQTGDWCSILRPTGDRAHKKKLFQGKVAVKNISFGKAVGAFQIEWSQDLARDD
jgi:hypothetical protein